MVRLRVPKQPAKLADLRRSYEALAGEYFEDNHIRHDFLLSRAVKI